jgi:extradiol dioxygenase family protein
MTTIDTSTSRAESVLRSACQTLLGTSPAVVSALSISIPHFEVGPTLEEWEAVARQLAEQYELRVEVSRPRLDLHVRISRYVDGRSS